MNMDFSTIVWASLKTALLLVFVEIISSAVFPAIRLEGFKPPFNVLIVLYISFKVSTPLVPFVILFLQNIHAVFSIEGWAVTTIVGVIIYLFVKFLKDLLDFSNALSTIVVVQIFQLIWFVLQYSLLGFKIGSFDMFLPSLWRVLPESILLSCVSPVIFLMLDQVWVSERKSVTV